MNIVLFAEVTVERVIGGAEASPPPAGVGARQAGPLRARDRAGSLRVCGGQPIDWKRDRTAVSL